MTTKTRTRSLRVRAAEPKDAPAITQIFAGPSVFGGTLQLPYPSESAWTERLSQRDPSIRSLVVEQRNQLIAIGSLHLEAPGRLRRRFAASLGMSVLESAQGRGVGGVLLDALLDLGERWCGILRFELDVWVDNPRAIALYRSRGFLVEGIARGYALRDGALVDAFHMARVSESLPWPRVTAEDAAARTPRLPATPKRDPKSN